VTPADVLLANLLSLRLGWAAVIPMFAHGETPATQLRHRLNDALTESWGLPALEDCDDVQVQAPALAVANRATDAMRLVGRKRDWTIVTVSKVLSRLAPTVPPIDSHVKRFYATQWGSEIRIAMRDDPNRKQEPAARSRRAAPSAQPADAADSGSRHRHLDGGDRQPSEVAASDQGAPVWFTAHHSWPRKRSLASMRSDSLEW
jgi:hypothetical protein